jgi:hypothetical protein
MPIDYDQAGALQSNLPFGLRVKVATVKFANYIANEAPNVPQHAARWRWASNTLNDLDGTARKLQQNVVMQQSILDADIDATDGDSTVDDATLQTAVETVANQFI